MRSSLLAKLAALTSVCGLFWALPSGAGAGTVIVDDEVSARFLANEIATSSGTRSEEYDRYSRKLARTLSMLTPEQQLRVLGTVNLDAGAPNGTGESDGGTPGAAIPSGGTGSATTGGIGDGGNDNGGATSTGGDSGGEVDGVPQGGNGEDLSEEEAENMLAFEEFLTGGDNTSWDATSTPWWWSLFQQIFRDWLKNSGGGRA